ncbi:MAG: hypothetical protein ABSD52_01795 [Candidatus Cybelea sp.]|jgi:hypothetical protein
MFAIATFVLAVLGITVAQAPAPMPPLSQPPLESGSCLDSPRPVPKVLMKPVARNMQLVRIDEVVSTSTMMSGQTIGFLYTTADGGTWLGQRTNVYMSAANATAINAVLASTHVMGVANNEFPPQSRYGKPTGYPQYFRVQIPPTALSALRVELIPCVVWPTTRPLPDPNM